MLLAVALLGKLFGAALAARLAGFDGRSSAVIGVLMNTRGLTELIVLNLALEKGVISDALFAMLVIMALRDDADHRADAQAARPAQRAGRSAGGRADRGAGDCRWRSSRRW